MAKYPVVTLQSLVCPGTNANYKLGDKLPESNLYFLRHAKRPKVYAGSLQDVKAFQQHKRAQEKTYLKKLRSFESKERFYNIYAETLLRAAKRRIAKKNNGATISITKEWIVQRLQVGFCELTGLPFNTQQTNQPTNASLDRIDSTNPNYTETNCRLVCYQVNTALNRFSEQESLPVIQALARALEQKYPCHK